MAGADHTRSALRTRGRVTLTCEHCRTTFVRQASRARNFCSHACANAGAVRHPVRPCRICGTSFKPKFSGAKLRECCSRACGSRLASLTKSRWEPIVVRVHFAHCDCCTRLFRSAQSRARYCSSACRQTASDTLRTRTCTVCEKKFIPQQSGSYKTCSPACLSELHKRRKAAWKKTDSYRRMKRNRRAATRASRRLIKSSRVDVLTVFARDGWCCQLCGTPTPQALRGTYQPNAPELDHKIPLARGGTHDPSNVRCLCRQCNTRKGSKLDHEMTGGPSRLAA